MKSVLSCTSFIEIEFEIDGPRPSDDKLMDAVRRLISEAGYIGSEEVDGTEDWGLEIGCWDVRLEKEGE